MKRKFDNIRVTNQFINMLDTSKFGKWGCVSELKTSIHRKLRGQQQVYGRREYFKENLNY